MAEYIDREALIVNLNRFAPEQYSALINNLIVGQPAADVEPVRHGRWELVGADKRGRGGIWKCAGRDGCGKTYPCKCDFCPNCGARMDGDTE